MCVRVYIRVRYIYHCFLLFNFRRRRLGHFTDTQTQNCLLRNSLVSLLARIHHGGLNEKREEAERLTTKISL